MPYRLSDQELDQQLQSLVHLCTLASQGVCNSRGDPPQIQAIQLLHQLEQMPEQLCRLWGNYHATFQTIINRLHKRIANAQGCNNRRADCHFALGTCQPEEHYFILVVLLQECQIHYGAENIHFQENGCPVSSPLA